MGLLYRYIKYYERSTLRHNTHTNTNRIFLHKRQVCAIGREGNLSDCDRLMSGKVHLLQTVTKLLA